MEAEERPVKMRKLSHSGVGVAQPVVQLPLEPEKVVDSEGAEQSVSKGDQNDSQSDADEPQSTEDETPATEGKAVRPAGMSKNAWKKIQKKAEWEAGREFRKVKRKEKIQAKKARDRAAKVQAKAKDAAETPANSTAVKSRAGRHVKLPVTFLIDCGFDDLMMEKERISLASQLTRSYSDNSRAQFQAHLVVSSWGGELKERFDTVLAKHYENWKGVVFTEKDFVEAAQMAKEAMKGKFGGQMAGIFSRHIEEGRPEDASANNVTEPKLSTKETVPIHKGNHQDFNISQKPVDNGLSADVNTQDPGKAYCAPPGQLEQPKSPDSPLHENPDVHPTSETEVNEAPAVTDPAPTNGQCPVPPSSQSLPLGDVPLSESGEIIYLTSDSPYTLDELKPHSTYIIGGLVDKNRHKGICYRTACERGIKTAKLPIGEFMEMRSRFVLATNHVVEIMVRWLECGDWAKAFLDVIPKRKGGKLKDSTEDDGVEEEDVEAEVEGDGEIHGGADFTQEPSEVKTG